MFKNFPAVEALFIGFALVFCFLRTCHAADDPQTRAAPKPIATASDLFGSQKRSAPLASAAFGSYTRGCLAGSGQLPANGLHWQAMRLSRNRNWGHPRLLRYIERLSGDAARLDGWPGLLIGDISQPRGGPMPSGHSSHQIGLDVDIWFRPSPRRNLSMHERESVWAESLIKGRFELDRDIWSEGHAVLLRRAASYSNVARIFVHPAIKKELCEWAGGDRAWLRKIRAWYGHDDHFHVRLECPAEEIACMDQDQPPAGDGCGEELAWWFSAEAYRPGPAEKKPAPLSLEDLPAICRSVLESR
ncbi:MAG: penicillin-insensitive murein endopeptidase [Methylococcaceae bacterium]|nr:penicillin-insensitive murein endopeptidase [Methylococcaceae bacterium]MCI0732458.1 penicillin-insensitive murein endopeptidase [Methylococcaceae bacterium]